MFWDMQEVQTVASTGVSRNEAWRENGDVQEESEQSLAAALMTATCREELTKACRERGGSWRQRQAGARCRAARGRLGEARAAG
jgi:hypothetical protein